jgi:hypothetical protein
MYARFVLIVAVLTSTNAFAADPAPPPAQPATHQESHPADIVLASAGDVQSPTPADGQTSAPPKRRGGRVTSCRCGDPQTPEDQQQ